MARKLTDAERKKRRMEAVLAFVLGRIPTFGAEYAWATDGKALPKNQTRPPEWVRQAILRVNQTSFAPIYSRDPKKPGNASYGNFLQLMGMFSSEMGSFVDLPEPLKTAGTEDKEFAPYLDRIVKGVQKSMEPALKRSARAVKRVQKKLVPAGTKQLQENAANYQKGTTALLTADREFTKGRSATAQLYVLLWYFWPHLRFAGTTKEMFNSLGEYTDLKFTPKLVEKICTELGVFKGRVGRPRANKFLQPARGV
ncbi:MAG: hypothetical protein ABSG50_15145 [Opitutaceae bacterium]|jgi:hypothetical protein